MKEILYAIAFFLPAGIANMTPVLANKIPLLNRWKTPLDFGKSFRGKRIFGANKTWRGLVYGAIVGGVTGLVLYELFPVIIDTFTPGLQMNLLSLFFIGAALGAGALAGDAVESFFKRQGGVKPGESWFPFDQIDYIIGGLFFVWPFVQMTWRFAGIILLAYFGLHLFVSYIGYLLKFKDKPI